MSTIASEQTTKVQVATCGVRWRGWILPKTRGSSPSRPELNRMRACEFAAPISEEKMLVRPAR